MNFFFQSEGGIPVYYENHDKKPATAISDFMAHEYGQSDSLDTVHDHAREA